MNLLYFIKSNIYISGIFILLASFFASYIASHLLLFLFKKIIDKTKNDIDNKILKITSRPILWSSTILAFAAFIKFYFFDATLKHYLLLFLFTILIIIWVHPILRLIAILLHYFALRDKTFIKNSMLPLFINISVIVVWSLAVYLIFWLWGISLTAWLASAGIVGIAVGFAAKDTLANLISGIFILADAPYKVGDIIVLDSGEKGEVIHVGLRSTRIKTFDGVEITIPNAKMGNSQIVNETGTRIHKKVRLRIPIGISYDSSLEKAESILLDIAKKFHCACPDKEPQVRLMAFGASSINLELRIWIEDPANKGRVMDKINRGIHERFKEAGIEIPYNKMDIYIKEHNSKDD